MSTRSNLGIEHEDGTISSIYCHFDGYPEHHVPIMISSYNTFEKVFQLVSLGDMSSLEPTLDECCYYSRDRNEDLRIVKYSSFKEFDEAVDNDYAYLFRTDGWYMRKYGEEWKISVV